MDWGGVGEEVSYYLPSGAVVVRGTSEVVVVEAAAVVEATVIAVVETVVDVEAAVVAAEVEAVEVMVVGAAVLVEPAVEVAVEEDAVVINVIVVTGGLLVVWVLGGGQVFPSVNWASSQGLK